MPDVNLDDPNLGDGMLPPVFHHPKQKIQQVSVSGEVGALGMQVGGKPPLPGQMRDGEKDSMLESMIENTAQLDLDDQGKMDFYGRSSSRVYLERINQQMGNFMGDLDPSGLPGGLRPQAFDSPRSTDSSLDHGLPNIADLPSKDSARILCDGAIDNALVLLRFLHKPTFWNMFDRIYDVPTDLWTNEEHRYLPLIYATIALGTLFANTEEGQSDAEGYENATENGYAATAALVGQT